MDEQETLRLARDAIQQGDKGRGRGLLREVIQANPASEVAWLWLSAIVDDPALERECLERVLAINLTDEIAREALQRLVGQDGSTQTDAALRTAIRSDMPSATEPVGETEKAAALPSVLEFYGAGLVLPMLSPTFYWHAGRRKAMTAVYFFLLFALILTVIQALGISHTFGGFIRDAEQAFASGAFPRVSLQGGRVVVEGDDPFVREFDGPSILIVDTTGRYTPAHLRSYQSGFLLTRSTLYMWNGGQLQDAPLAQLQPMLGDPFVLDTALIRRVLNWVQTLVFGVLLLSNTVGKLLSLLFLAIIARAVANRFWVGAPYGPVFAIGIYALVPATYGARVLTRLGISFCLMPILLHLAVWAVGLMAAFAETREGILKGGRSLRPWRALVGVPMLLILALDAIFTWPRGGIWGLGITLLTLVALAGIGLWPILGEEGSGSSA